MRTTGYVHERNLMECVRRGVISAEQMEQVLAVARSMGRAEGDARPDFAWVSAVYALCAAGAVVAAMAWFYQHLCRMAAGEVAGASLALGAGMWALSAGARRWLAGGRAAAAALAAGACWAAWGVGAALGATVLRTASFGDPASMSSDANLWLAWMVGDALVLAAAAFVGLRGRVAAAALPGALALVHLCMTAFAWQYQRAGRSFEEFTASPYLAALGLLALLAGRAIDVRTRGTTRDAGFWLHLVGLLCLGFSALVRADYASAESAWFALAAGALLVAGVAQNRRVYLAVGAPATVYFAARFAQSGALPDGALPAVVAGTALFMAAGAGWLRRRALAAWATAGAPAVERTVWE